MRFQDRVAVITGGGSGIGAATARLMAREGAKVVVVDLAEAPARAVADEIGGTAITADVADRASAEAFVEAAVDRHGRIDILVNNAGIGCFGRTPDLAPDNWERVIAIDLNAVFYACRAAIPHMTGGKAAIVNTASISGMAGDYGFTAYNAAKAGVINYTRCLAIDHARDNIRANSICPGPVDTPLLTSGVDEIEGLRTEWERVVPAGRFARPEEIAAVALFLASDDASGMTGATVPVDGGLTAHTGQPDLRDVLGAAGQA